MTFKPPWDNAMYGSEDTYIFYIHRARARSIEPHNSDPQSQVGYWLNINMSNHFLQALCLCVCFLLHFF